MQKLSYENKFNFHENKPKCEMRNNFQMDGFAKDFFDGCYTLFKRATQLKLNKKRPRYSGGRGIV